MGVAFGRFFPLPAYSEFQEAVIASRVGGQSHLNLTVRLKDGDTLPAQAIWLHDYTPEQGDEALQVDALGIPYPPYAELFPEQCEYYKTRWDKKE